MKFGIVGLCVLIKRQKLFYVQIKCRSSPVPLSLCVAAVSQTDSQCPLIISEAFHAWKEECVTISPREIVHQQLVCENCINWCLVWNFFETTFCCYIININSSDFSRLFCYLLTIHAQYLFPLVWYNIYGSFCSHELKFSVMQQLCSTLVFLLSRRHFWCNSVVATVVLLFWGWKKIAAREKGNSLDCFPKATQKTGQMYIHWPFSLNTFLIHWLIFISQLIWQWEAASCTPLADLAKMS